jgi:thymidylate kinase
VDVVIAQGPFFESASYESLFAAVPVDVRRHHVLLRVPFDVALERVRGDPRRDSTASSLQPDFLRSTHDAFVAIVGSLPPIDIDVDTAGLTADAVAAQVFARLQRSGS